MTDLEHAIIDLDLEYSRVIKPFYERRAALLGRIKAEMQVGAMFQDPGDGTVFEITQPSGTFVEFRDRGWNRTRRAYLGETRSDLSLKRAREQGFVLGPNQTEVIKAQDDPNLQT